MTLQLKIVSSNSEIVGDDTEREFDEDGGTIGRSLDNDWIIPDPDRFISGRHALIDHKGGIYYLLDTSSNGVYINDEAEPIGKGNPRRLFDGDRIRMGDFEFAATVESGESLAMPLDPEPSVAPDNIEQMVEEVSPRTGVKLLDEEEITGDDEFQSVLFGKPEDKPKKEKRKPKAKRKAKEKGKSKAKAKAKAKSKVRDTSGSESKSRIQASLSRHARSNKKAVDVTAEDLFDSFLDGLGVSRAEFHPSVNRPELMLTAGHVLREFVAGVVNLLAARANLKNAFRLDQTTLLPRHNNPLKFSESPKELVKQLLVGDEGDYLGARDAVREACHDLLNHQNAFLDAMNSAFIEFSERFEPDELEAGFERATKGSKLFSFGNKSKYWDLYRDLYPIMTEKGGGRFPQMFGEEFVRAYERQIADYQRRDREALAENDDTVSEPSDQLKSTQEFTKAGMGRKLLREAAKTAKTDDPVSETGADEIDQSFIDELENSMAKDISGDQLKA